ncbi:MAG: hypothetical protein K2N87_10940 [Eubacterium sp.]|nr:hypothetical protein [Eubacterium sp.]
MSEEIKEMGIGDAELEEFNKLMQEKCKSEEDAINLVMGEMAPGQDSGELTEDDLEFVAGGVSKMNAVRCVTSAYWNMCVLGKKSCGYSADYIYESLRVVDGMMNEAASQCGSTLKKAWRTLNRIFPG